MGAPGSGARRQFFRTQPFLKRRISQVGSGGQVAQYDCKVLGFSIAVEAENLPAPLIKKYDGGGIADVHVFRDARFLDYRPVNMPDLTRSPSIEPNDIESPGQRIDHAAILQRLTMQFVAPRTMLLLEYQRQPLASLGRLGKRILEVVRGDEEGLILQPFRCRIGRSPALVVAEGFVPVALFGDVAQGRPEHRRLVVAGH